MIWIDRYSMVTVNLIDDMPMILFGVVSESKLNELYGISESRFSQSMPIDGVIWILFVVSNG